MGQTQTGQGPRVFVAQGHVYHTTHRPTRRTTLHGAGTGLLHGGRRGRERTQSLHADPRPDRHDRVPARDPGGAQPVHQIPPHRARDAPGNAGRQGEAAPPEVRHGPPRGRQQRHGERRPESRGLHRVQRRLPQLPSGPGGAQPHGGRGQRAARQPHERPPRRPPLPAALPRGPRRVARPAGGAHREATEVQGHHARGLLRPPSHGQARHRQQSPAPRRKTLPAVPRGRPLSHRLPQGAVLQEEADGAAGGAAQGSRGLRA